MGARHPPLLPELAGLLHRPATAGRAVAIALWERAAAALASIELKLSRRLADPVGWQLASAAAHAIAVDLVQP